MLNLHPILARRTTSSHVVPACVQPTIWCAVGCKSQCGAAWNDEFGWVWCQTHVPGLIFCECCLTSVMIFIIASYFFGLRTKSKACLAGDAAISVAMTDSSLLWLQNPSSKAVKLGPCELFGFNLGSFSSKKAGRSSCGDRLAPHSKIILHSSPWSLLLWPIHDFCWLQVLQRAWKSSLCLSFWWKTLTWWCTWRPSRHRRSSVVCQT